MKRLALGLSLLALLVFAPAVSAGQSQFAGMWVSTDPDDGSTQVLLVSAGVAPAVTYIDFYASSCANGGSPTTQFTAAGRGSVDADTLVADFHKTGCGRSGMGGFTFGWTYDSGTLVDDFGIVWYRSGP
jgi:hypothetical protein